MVGLWASSINEEVNSHILQATCNDNTKWFIIFWTTQSLSKTMIIAFLPPTRLSSWWEAKQLKTRRYFLWWPWHQGQMYSFVEFTHQGCLLSKLYLCYSVHCLNLLLCNYWCDNIHYKSQDSINISMHWINTFAQSITVSLWVKFLINYSFLH